jgi:hypothetical protein
MSETSRIEKALLMTGNDDTMTTKYQTMVMELEASTMEF